MASPVVFGEQFMHAAEQGDTAAVLAILALPDAPQELAMGAPACGAADAAIRFDRTELLQALLERDETECEFSQMQLDSLFGTACEAGNLEALNVLLALNGRQRVDVHCFGEQPWQCACAAGHTHIVQALLALGGDRRIDVHAGDEAGFLEACANGHEDVVRLLLELQGDRRIDVHAQHERAFRSACAREHLHVAQLLLGLEGGRRPDTTAGALDTLQLICQRGKVHAFDFILGLPSDPWGSLGDAQRQNLFQIACGAAGASGTQLVERMLELQGGAAVDVRADSDAAFVVACGGGNVDTVRLLLGLRGERRIDVPAVAERSLQAAIAARRAGVVAELLSLTGDRAFDARFLDVIALERACRSGSPEVVRAILQGTAPSLLRMTTMMRFIRQAVFDNPAMAREMLLAQPCDFDLCALLGERLRKMPSLPVPSIQEPEHRILSTQATAHAVQCVAVHLLQDQQDASALASTYDAGAFPNVTAIIAGAAALSIRFLCLGAALPVLCFTPAAVRRAKLGQWTTLRTVQWLGVQVPVVAWPGREQAAAPLHSALTRCGRKRMVLFREQAVKQRRRAAALC